MITYYLGKFVVVSFVYNKSTSGKGHGINEQHWSANPRHLYNNRRAGRILVILWVEENPTFFDWNLLTELEGTINFWEMHTPQVLEWSVVCHTKIGPPKKRSPRNFRGRKISPPGPSTAEKSVPPPAADGPPSLYLLILFLCPYLGVCLVQISCLYLVKSPRCTPTPWSPKLPSYRYVYTHWLPPAIGRRSALPPLQNTSYLCEHFIAKAYRIQIFPHKAILLLYINR